jgi:hypothetical protein
MCQAAKSFSLSKLRQQYCSDSFSQFPENFVDCMLPARHQGTKKAITVKTTVSKEYRNGMRGKITTYIF